MKYKYIRTKDCRIVDVSECFIDEEQKFFVNVSTGEKVSLSDAIKGTETLEELCDEFDWKWNEKEFPYSIVRQHDRYSSCGDLKRAIRREENYGKCLHYDYEIYGGIWTDQGFIYKAKMKGVLSNGEIVWELL